MVAPFYREPVVQDAPFENLNPLGIGVAPQMGTADNWLGNDISMPLGSSGLRTNPFSGGSPFRPGSSPLAFGQVGMTNQVASSGVVNFGQNTGRGQMTGRFTNYGLPTERSYVDPTMAQSPLDRMNLQTEKILQEIRSTFWPSGVNPVNNRQNPGSTAGGTAVSEGIGNGTGGNWAAINALNDWVLQAAGQVQQQTGIYIPPNVIKAVINIESQGTLAPGNAWGYGGYMGSPVSSAYSAYLPDGFTPDYSRVTTDGAYSIFMGTMELAGAYQALENAGYGQGEKNWTDVVAVHFAGLGGFRNMGAGDAYNTVADYRNMFETYMSQLQAGTDVNAAVPTGALNSIWGGGDFQISQDFGLTDWAMGDGRWMYEDYSASLTPGGAYGGHPAIDVGMPIGTALYAPVTGTVIQSGGVSWEVDERFGATPQTGGLRIELSNGDVIVLGHMSEIALRVGDKVTAGQYVGKSGTNNGPHLHIEARRYTPGATSSGYTAIDPKIYFTGGGFVGTGGPGDTQNFTQGLIPGLPGPSGPRYGSNALPFWLR